MANLSSLPSASHQRPPSAFQWPPASSELSIKEILDAYHHDPELLKVVLSAKAEEDKKLTIRNTLQVEEARIQQRKMDLETLRVYYTNNQHPAPLPPPSLPQPPLPSTTAGSSLSPYPYYPYHQAHRHHNHYEHPPLTQPPPQQPPPPGAATYSPFSSTSRSRYYQAPHSAHPLSSTVTTNGSHNNKRPRPSTASATNRGGEGEKVSHELVMEALKAKLQRGEAKRARTLPKPLVNPSMHKQHTTSNAASIPSTPRSAKPILPPIDTSVGRLQHQQQGTSSSSGPHTSPYGGYSHPRLPPFSAAIADLTPSSSTPTAADDLKRRVRSLSPPSFTTHHHRK